jgi:hypothetical protein
MATYSVTRHASLNGQPGIVNKVVDYGDREIPRKIHVMRAFNGGPKLYYGNAIIVLKLF